MDKSNINKFKLRRYNNIDKIILASFQDNKLNLKDLKQSTGFGFDIHGKECEFSYKDQVNAIKTQGYWGWVDENKVIHYWIGKKPSLEQLIHFFGHEIGHRTGTLFKSDYKEEMRAEGYGSCATLAYKFAKKIKNER